MKTHSVASITSAFDEPELLQSKNENWQGPQGELPESRARNIPVITPVTNLHFNLSDPSKREPIDYGNHKRKERRMEKRQREKSWNGLV